MSLEKIIVFSVREQACTVVYEKAYYEPLESEPPVLSEEKTLTRGYLAPRSHLSPLLLAAGLSD